MEVNKQHCPPPWPGDPRLPQPPTSGCFQRGGSNAGGHQPVLVGSGDIPPLDPRRKQDGVVVVLPPGCQRVLGPFSGETYRDFKGDSSRESPEQLPRGSSEGSPGKSPAVPPAEATAESPGQPRSCPQPHLPRMVQLVEEALPPGIVSCRVVPRSGEGGGKKDKRPAPASTPRMQKTSPRDNMPPKKKMMVVCWVAKHSKTLWEGKPDRDGVAVGSKWVAASAGHLRTPMCPPWRLSDPEALGVPGDKGACARPSTPPTADREGAEHGSLQCATPGQAAVQKSPGQNAAGVGDAPH
ncbi:uncharacterized protein LOC115350338 isoform X1 [Aquila chrysaetos chrysaetos]|uniref:uncharacterized protein LOC115350338 isoform X1 n=1 Tax=Aquila chrysaetos chrysaetos TaxID=223781 RepID=UPI0011765006|nr:uncharacterized protein LOC115350338 isoform X1 [Aquila chrysaetos chrysaetos]